MKDRQLEKINYINEILDHQKIVIALMTLVELNRDKLSFNIPEWKLMERATKHDSDKFVPSIANKIVNLYTEDIIDEAAVYLAKAEHRINSSHHVEYHNGVAHKLSNIDICEMCCDWVASSKKRYYIGSERATNFNTTKELALKTIEKYGFSLQKQKFIEVLDLINSLIKLEDL